MRPRAADLDFVPVGVPQLDGTLGSLHVWLENREIIAKPNIDPGSRACKRKKALSLTIFY